MPIGSICEAPTGGSLSANRKYVKAVYDTFGRYISVLLQEIYEIIRSEKGNPEGQEILLISCDDSIALVYFGQEERAIFNP